MTEISEPPLAPGACCDTAPCTCQRDPFWQQQIDKHVASRGQHADPTACGTCRAAVQDGKKVEHDECTQRALLVQPPDMPDWEILVEMTEQEKADLPARFHLPVFESLGKPNAWLCAVCWGDGWSYRWPCATATKYGTQVFTPDHEATRHHEQLLDRVADLEATLERYVGKEPTVAEEMAYLNRCLNAVHDLCREAEKQATRWEQPLPVPEWVDAVRKAAGGESPVEDEVVNLRAMLADREREIAELKAAEPTLDDDQPAAPR